MLRTQNIAKIKNNIIHDNEFLPSVSADAVFESRMREVQQKLTATTVKFVFTDPVSLLPDSNRKCRIIS